MVADRIKGCVREIKDFPKEGILFRDITPVLLDPALCADMVKETVAQLNGQDVDAVVAIESRGFIFGPLIAQELEVPFVPIRKAGKLPAETIVNYYDLEYGSAAVEIHKNDLPNGSKVMVHDDLLATGGTAAAAAELVKQIGSEVAAFSFLVSLDFLKGREKLTTFSEKVITLAQY
jgi:adenine phosphoribosyltransferase